MWLLQEAFDLGRWLHATSSPAEPAEYPKFVAPAKSDSDGDKVHERERAALARRFAAQEAEMQRLLADLEAARSDARAAQSTAAQLQAALGEGQRAAAALAFDEQATRRRLIDSLLAAAGWDVGAAGASTESVGQEVEVLHQPTAGGSGRADYVPWGDDGKPLAVVEAKRTADAEAGRTQAKLYADGLEQAHGRRPAIFYTNGHDVWLWHDALGDSPRRLFGFYSKDSLEYLHFQRLHRGRLADPPPAPDIAGRMYQIEAIRRVVERFSNRHRKTLVVQATRPRSTRCSASSSRSSRPGREAAASDYRYAPQSDRPPVDRVLDRRHYQPADGHRTDFVPDVRPAAGRGRDAGRETRRPAEATVRRAVRRGPPALALVELQEPRRPGHAARRAGSGVAAADARAAHAGAVGAVARRRRRTGPRRVSGHGRVAGGREVRRRLGRAGAGALPLRGAGYGSGRGRRANRIAAPVAQEVVIPVRWGGQ